MLRDEASKAEAIWCGVDNHAGHEEQCARLHRTLKRIVKARGSLDAQEAEALREAEKLRIWRYYGYSSLLEYIEMEMGYAPRAAIERLRVAKAIVELPAIAEAMAQGALSFSAGRELTRVATPETEQQWLGAANDKNLRQVEDLVSGHKPGDTPDDPVDPKLRKRRLRYDEIDEETVALVREARKILERELGERLDDDAFMRALARTVVDGARSPERSHAPYQIAVTVCAQCKRGWQDGGGITVEMAPDKLAAALCDAQHIGAVDHAVDALHPAGGIADQEAAGSAPEVNDGMTRTSSAVKQAGSGNEPMTGSVLAFSGAPESPARKRAATRAMPIGSPAQGEPSSQAQAAIREKSGSSAASRQGPPQTQSAARAKSGSSVAPRQELPQMQSEARAKSDIPPALRRKVRARDHGRCRVPWCRSARNIDQHHIRPLSLGGQHTLENIISLCESHHLAHHAGALVIEGTAADAIFTRRAHHAFAIAERVVDTKRALETLGFDKHEVRTAIEQTRTHVGTAELPLEQWIKIALSYCPKPHAR